MSHCYHDDSPQFDCSARRCPYCPEPELVQPGDEGAAAIGPAVETKFESWGRERDQREDD